MYNPVDGSIGDNMKNRYIIPEITPRTHKQIEEKRLKKKQQQQQQQNNNNDNVEYERSVDDQMKLLQEDCKNNEKEIDPWEDPKYETIVKSIIY